jgi:hypothetical protein
MWGTVLFQIFMAGILALNKAYILAGLLGPLILFTVWWGWNTDRTFRPLSSYVSLCSASEVQRGEDSEEFVKLKAGHPVTRSQRRVLYFPRLRVIELFSVTSVAGVMLRTMIPCMWLQKMNILIM